MPRFRVEVTRIEGHFVDAPDLKAACEKGIALTKAKVKPTYTGKITADAEIVSEVKATTA